MTAATEKLTARLQAGAQKINALTLRERLFVFAAALILVASIWDFTLNMPLQRRTDAANAALGEASQRLAALDEAIIAAASGFDAGIGSESARLRALTDAVASREQELRIFTSDLVNPSQMRLVVEDLIKRQQGLRLLRTRNLPARPLVPPDESAQTAQPSDPEQRNLYRHGLVIELEGSYLQLLDYLESIERLPWRIFFDRLDVLTVEHPRLHITLELTTLSLDEEWLGV